MQELETVIIDLFMLEKVFIKKNKNYFICDIGGVKRKIIDVTDKNAYFTMQDQLCEKLMQKGFNNIEKFYKTRFGELVFVCNKNSFVMTDYYENEKSDFKNTEEFLIIVKCLGEFHKEARNLEIEVVEDNNLFIKKYFDNSYEELRLLRKKVSKHNNKSDFDLIFLKTFDKYKYLMEKAIKLVRDINVEKIEKLAIGGKHILHGNLKEDTIIIEDGVILKDFENIKLGYQINDLGDIIKKYIRYSDINEGLASFYEIIDAYSEHVFLDETDVDILKAIVIFPSSYCSLIKNYYEKKRTWTPTSTFIRLENLNDLMIKTIKYMGD